MTLELPQAMLDAGYAVDGEAIVWKGTVKGKSVTVPVERAAAAINKGIAFESNQAALKAREETLAADEVGFREYQQLRDAIGRNPDLAKAIAAAIQDPSRVLQGAPAPKGNQQGSQADADGDGSAFDDPAPKATDDAVSRRLDALAAENQSIKTELEQTKQERQLAELKQKIALETEQYPWLVGKRADRAVADALRAIELGSREPVGVLVAQSAQDIKDLLEAEQAGDLARSESRQSLRTQHPGAGRPQATPPKTYKPGEAKKALEDGSILKEALKAAQAYGFNVNPQQTE